MLVFNPAADLIHQECFSSPSCAEQSSYETRMKTAYKFIREKSVYHTDQIILNMVSKYREIYYNYNKKTQLSN